MPAALLAFTTDAWIVFSVHKFELRPVLCLPKIFSLNFFLLYIAYLGMFFRVYVSGLMKGGADMFVENMPGFPDNIRPSSSGGYWVAAAAIRANPGFSMLDFLAEKPFIKRMIFKVIMKTDSRKQDGCV